MLRSHPGLLALPLFLAALACAATGPLAAEPKPDDSATALAPLVGGAASELRDVVERYAADRAALFRRYDADYSPARRARLRAFYTGWRARLGELDFDALSQEGKV